MIRDKTGVDLLPVPYNGSGQALTGLLRGDVQASIDTITAALGPIRQGQMSAIAISTDSRSDSIADLPTLKESGIDVTLEAWNALYGPRGTPAAVVQMLNRAVNDRAGRCDPSRRPGAGRRRSAGRPAGGSRRADAAGPGDLGAHRARAWG
jgi:tripartite-type tricarboxylate transporter receptor subunit TctC